MADGIEVYIIECPFNYSWDVRDYDSPELQPINMRRLSGEYSAIVSRVARNPDSVLVIGNRHWDAPAQELYNNAKTQLARRLVLLDEQDKDSATCVINRLKQKNPRAVYAQGEFAYGCATSIGVKLCKVFGLLPQAFALNLRGSFIRGNVDSTMPDSKDELTKCVYGAAEEGIEILSDVFASDGMPLGESELQAHRKRLEEPIPDFVEWWWPQIEALKAQQQT